MQLQNTSVTNYRRTSKIVSFGYVSFIQHPIQLSYSVYPVSEWSIKLSRVIEVAVQMMLGVCL